MSLRRVFSICCLSTQILLGCASWGWTQNVPASPPKVQRYAEWLIARYDANRDGRLQKEEWQKLRGQPAAIDRDQDGVITLPELMQHLVEYGKASQHPANPAPSGTPPAAASGSPKEAEEAAANSRRRSLKFFVPREKLPEGLPDWFLARDLDGDAQLTKGEFAPPGVTVDMSEFQRLDANQDGLLTAEECVHRAPTAPEKPASPPQPPAKP
ncbi:MAG: hypothetical protein U0903_10855 [Planctomycetales bacterium]